MPTISINRRLLTLAALGLTLGSAQAAWADTLRVGVQGELASFDTAQVSGGVWESDILNDVYEGLIKIDPKGGLLPGMATSWDISEDGKTYTFHMREDAKWSDGKPVTAEDFVFGWQHMLDPKMASKYAYMLYPIKNAEAVNMGEKKPAELGAESLDGGKTLKVTLTHSTPYFLQLLTHYTSFPAPKHLVEANGKQWVNLDKIATNGAFKPVEWVSQASITLEKSSTYYDSKDVALDSVEYYTIEDRNAGISRFRAGELDVMRDYPSDRYQWLKEQLPDATHMSAQLGSYYYVLNQRDSKAATSDKRVREALNLAIRRDIISDKIMAGSFKPSLTLVPEGTAEYKPQSMDLGPDDMNARMKKAQALLKEAGYGPDKPLTLRLRYNTDDEHKKIAVAVAAMWKPLGINVQMINAEATVHYQTIAQGDFDVARAGWIADYNDAENFLTLLSTGVGNNYGQYSNKEYDTLMKEAAQTIDLAKRERILEKAEKLAMNDFAMIPLLTYVSRNLVNPKLQGWEDNVEDDHPSRWVSFKK